jgi:hypothetical protein
MAQKKTAGRKPAQQKGTRQVTAQSETWVVTTSSDRPIGDVAKDLSAAGFKVDQKLDAIGVITGTSDQKAVEKARTIRGVTDVSPEPKVDIGPPGSSDTW